MNLSLDILIYLLTRFRYGEIWVCFAQNWQNVYLIIQMVYNLQKEKIMAVYVDEAKWAWRGQYWCHMVADSIDELHAFADLLGMKREWFQDKRLPHYDMNAKRRERALKLGALRISSNRQLISLSKALRIELDTINSQQKAVNKLLEM